MLKQAKQEWIAALRSGEYKQARGHLNHTDGWCCLGVLCDLQVKKPDSPWEWVADSEYIKAIVHKGEEEEEEGPRHIWNLPRRMVQDLKLQVNDPETSDLITELISMNDGYGNNHRDFNGIATWIEENIKEVDNEEA